MQVPMMLEAYLDESGIHDGAVMCVVAGYYGWRPQWRQLEKAWRKVLGDFNVPLERFHAKDLVPKPQGFFFKWQTQMRDSFLHGLANAIGDSGIRPVSSGVVVSDFFSFSRQRRRLMSGATIKSGKLITSGSPEKPYFVVFMQCLRRLACYAPENGKVHFFFGLGKPFADYATALLSQTKSNPLPMHCKDRLGEASYPLAKETPQLQAADLLVHLTYQHMLARHAEDDWNVQPHTALAMCIGNAASAGDFALLDKTCLQAGLNEAYGLGGKAWEKVAKRRRH